MNNTEKQLEFDKVKAVWKELALTEYAKNKIVEMRPILSENELSAAIRETSESKILMEKNGFPPLDSLQGLKEWGMIAEKGGCLSAEQLEGVEMALTAVSRLKKYLEQGKTYEISLAYYEENLDPLTEIRDRIRMQIRSGRVDDQASKLLKTCRNQIEKEEDSMRQKADRAMRAGKSYMADSFSTIRNGHLCIPVKKEYKNKVAGIVIDQSSTGNTVFMEPAAVSRHYEEIQLLKIREENEERRILYELTAYIHDNAEVIEQNIRMIEKLDFIFSKGKLSLEWDAAEPKINTERKIVLEDGRHPLMERKSCVPLQFSMEEGTRGVVITGPNTGGKTVAIKTVALNCMMAQCGLHVTCRRAMICMNSSFLCDIGDGQNLSENLSTFSAHIANVLDILRRINGESLVIMDELGSGTDPTEGMGIAIAILEELKKSGALFLVTTHYPEVKQYAEHTDGIVNARMTFDKESLKPLYQLVIGEAGESCAFYIAGRMGMPKTMLETAAKAAYNGTLPEELKQLCNEETLKKTHAAKVQKRKTKTAQESKSYVFRIGDSVMIYPDKKIGIVCQTANEKGVLRVQMPQKKIWINQKRVKLQVAADQLYPEDYDFSIVFDTVENRKLRHQMDRGKCVDGEIRIVL